MRLYVLLTLYTLTFVVNGEAQNWQLQVDGNAYINNFPSKLCHPVNPWCVPVGYKLNVTIRSNRISKISKMITVKQQPWKRLGFVSHKTTFSAIVPITDTPKGIAECHVSYIPVCQIGCGLTKSRSSEKFRLISSGMWKQTEAFQGLKLKQIPGLPHYLSVNVSLTLLNGNRNRVVPTRAPFHQYSGKYGKRVTTTRRPATSVTRKTSKSTTVHMLQQKSSGRPTVLPGTPDQTTNAGETTVDLYNPIEITANTFSASTPDISKMSSVETSTGYPRSATPRSDIFNSTADKTTSVSPRTASSMQTIAEQSSQITTVKPESKSTAEPQTELTGKITSTKETLTTADILDAKSHATAQPDKESFVSFRTTTNPSGSQAKSNGTSETPAYMSSVSVSTIGQPTSTAVQLTTTSRTNITETTATSQAIDTSSHSTTRPSLYDVSSSAYSPKIANETQTATPIRSGYTSSKEEAFSETQVPTIKTTSQYVSTVMSTRGTVESTETSATLTETSTVGPTTTYQETVASTLPTKKGILSTSTVTFADVSQTRLETTTTRATPEETSWNTEPTASTQAIGETTTSPNVSFSKSTTQLVETTVVSNQWHTLSTTSKAEVVEHRTSGSHLPTTATTKISAEISSSSEIGKPTTERALTNTTLSTTELTSTIPTNATTLHQSETSADIEVTKRVDLARGDEFSRSTSQFATATDETTFAFAKTQSTSVTVDVTTAEHMMTTVNELTTSRVDTSEAKAQTTVSTIIILTERKPSVSTESSKTGAIGVAETTTSRIVPASTVDISRMSSTETSGYPHVSSTHSASTRFDIFTSADETTIVSPMSTGPTGGQHTQITTEKSDVSTHSTEISSTSTSSVVDNETSPHSVGLDTKLTTAEFPATLQTTTIEGTTEMSSLTSLRTTTGTTTLHATEKDNVTELSTPKTTGVGVNQTTATTLIPTKTTETVHGTTFMQFSTTSSQNCAKRIGKFCREENISCFCKFDGSTLVGCDLNHCNQPCNKTIECATGFIVMPGQTNRVAIVSGCFDGECLIVVPVGGSLKLPICSKCKSKCSIRADGSLALCDDVKYPTNHTSAGSSLQTSTYRPIYHSTTEKASPTSASNFTLAQSTTLTNITETTESLYITETPVIVSATSSIASSTQKPTVANETATATSIELDFSSAKEAFSQTILPTLSTTEQYGSTSVSSDVTVETTKTSSILTETPTVGPTTDYQETINTTHSTGKDILSPSATTARAEPHLTTSVTGQLVTKIFNKTDQTHEESATEDRFKITTEFHETTTFVTPTTTQMDEYSKTTDITTETSTTSEKNLSVTSTTTETTTNHCATRKRIWCDPIDCNCRFFNGTIVGCDLSNCNQPCNTSSDCGVARVRTPDNRARLISAQCRDSQCVMVATPLHLPICTHCESVCLLKTDGSIFKCVGKDATTAPSVTSVHNTTRFDEVSNATYPLDITKTTEQPINHTKFHTVEASATEVIINVKEPTTPVQYETTTNNLSRFTSTTEVHTTRTQSQSTSSTHPTEIHANITETLQSAKDLHSTTPTQAVPTDAYETQNRTESPTSTGIVETTELPIPTEPTWEETPFVIPIDNAETHVDASETNGQPAEEFQIDIPPEDNQEEFEPNGDYDRVPDGQDNGDGQVIVGFPAIEDSEVEEDPNGGETPVEQVGGVTEETFAAGADY